MEGAQHTGNTSYTKYRIHRVPSIPCTAYTMFSWHRVHHSASTAYTKYGKHQVKHTASTAHTECSISREQHTPCTAYTKYSTDQVQHPLCTAHTTFSIFPRLCFSHSQPVSQLSADLVVLNSLHSHPYKLPNENSLSCRNTSLLFCCLPI